MVVKEIYELRLPRIESKLENVVYEKDADEELHYMDFYDPYGSGD